MKLFCVGPPKSGTSTLNRACREAGLNSCHHMVEGRPAARLLWDAYSKGLPPFSYIPGYVDCIFDAHLTKNPGFETEELWPGFHMGFLLAVKQHHPNTLILLNTRNVDNWILSVARWRDLHQRITASDLPHLPAGLGGNASELRDWISGHYDRVRSLGLNLLEVSVEDEATPRKLEAALGLRFPWWGRENAS